MSNPYKNLASAIVLITIDDTIRAIQGKNPRGYSNKINNYEHIIQENIRHIMERIQTTCKKTRRDPKDQLGFLA